MVLGSLMWKRLLRFSMVSDMSSLAQKRLECYSKEEFVEAMAKLAERYPAVFKHFVLHELRETKQYSPFNRDDERNKYIELSKEDLELFKNEKDSGRSDPGLDQE